jgi:hypothetical protein
MIIIESNNNFFTKCDIAYYTLSYRDKHNGSRYKINFIIVGKANYDNNFRNLISSPKLDRVYIKDGNDIEILSDLSLCERMTNSDTCVCNYCLCDIRLKSSIKIKKFFNKLIKDDDYAIRVSNNINYKNYAIFYNIVDDQMRNKKRLIKI